MTKITTEKKKKKETEISEDIRQNGGGSVSVNYILNKNKLHSTLKRARLQLLLLLSLVEMMCWTQLEYFLTM